MGDGASRQIKQCAMLVGHAAHADPQPQVVTMLKVLHAILHVFDFETGSSYLSERELDLSERPTRSYVQRHLHKVSSSPEAHQGTFSENSAFAEKIEDYFAGREEFIALSQDIGQYFWEELRKSDDPGQCDVLVADFEDTDAAKDKAAAAHAAVGVHPEHQKPMHTTNSKHQKKNPQS